MGKRFEELEANNTCWEAPTRVVWKDTGGPCLRIPGLLRWGEPTGEQVHLPPGGCGQRCPGVWHCGSLESDLRSLPPATPREIIWGTTGENCSKNLGSSGALPGPSRRDCWRGKERARGTDSCRARSDTKVRGWEEGGGLPMTKALAEPIGSSTVRLALENCPKFQGAPFTFMLSSH